ncbi:MAG: YHYH protein, partial [Schlesneria sp.]
MHRGLISIVSLFAWFCAKSIATAHPGHSHNETGEQMLDEIAARKLPVLLAQLASENRGQDDEKRPEIAKAFNAFLKTKAIRTRWDENFFYVESNGIPSHPMMIGITAWQQQVPLPQPYSGENAWRIPLRPVPAKNPLSTKNRFLRGAIALAANGIPIFNPLNNRGEDSYMIGELDEFGGHCGRADDYHYHIAPVHLEKTIGKGLPIAYALDGYPIYGYEEPDGSKVVGLDPFNGHKDANGNYHYHATKTYPYLNGGFHGEVTERGGQVDPQPRAEPVRPDGRPLRDAKITDFVETKPGTYKLTYEVRGKRGSVSYLIADDGSAKFT